MVGERALVRGRLRRGGHHLGGGERRRREHRGLPRTIPSSEENDFAYSLVTDDKFWFFGGAGNGIRPWLGGYQDEDENWL